MSVSEFESDSSKENQNPILRKGNKDSIFRDDAIIDMEIEQVEMEMSRLLLKLEALKLEKAKKKQLRISVRKQSTNPKLGFLQKIQDSKPPQQRRGVSLCPAEIYSATKSGRGASKQAVVCTNSSGMSAKQSSGSSSSRRQSCFWKLGEIDELKVKKAVTTTIKSNTVLKEDNAVVSSSVQPRRLFRDVERPSSAPQKKPPIQSSCRVVASRFTNTSQSSSVDGGVGKLRSLSMGGAAGSRVKKRWEIPAKGEVVVYKSDKESTPVIDEIADDMLPKVRTVRCVPEDC